MIHPMRIPAVLAVSSLAIVTASGAGPAVSFSDVTTAAGIRFVHNSGAFGKKYLPETIGSGGLFLDIDDDGWQDVLLVNSKNWHCRLAVSATRTTAALYCNARNGTFVDVTR